MASSGRRGTKFSLVDVASATEEAASLGQVGQFEIVEKLGAGSFGTVWKARGEGHEADRRTDIYSLGVILFQLLTGELPFRGSSRMLLHQVLNDEPPAPRTLKSHIPRDLETICLKCLEKDPGRRYGTAREVKDELDRQLRGEPIEARPITQTERLWRWSRRKPLVAGLSAAAVVLLLAVAVVSTTAAIRIAASRRDQERENYYANIGLAKNHVDKGNIDQALDLLWKCPERYRHWEWGHLLYRCHQDVASFQVSTSEVQVIQFLQGTRQVLVRCDDGTLSAWAWDPPHKLFSAGDTTNRVVSCAVSEEDGCVAAALQDGRVRVWDSTHWRELAALDVGLVPITALGLTGPQSPRRLVAVGYGDDRVSLWDVESGRALHTRTNHLRPVTALTFSSDGSRLVTANLLCAMLWETVSGRLVRGYSVHGDRGELLFAGPGLTNVITLSETDHLRWWRFPESGPTSADNPRDAGNAPIVALLETRRGEP